MMTLPVATIAAPASTTSKLDNSLNPLPVKIVASASTMLTTIKLGNPLNHHHVLLVNKESIRITRTSRFVKAVSLVNTKTTNAQPTASNVHLVILVKKRATGPLVNLVNKGSIGMTNISRIVKAVSLVNTKTREETKFAKIVRLDLQYIQMKKID